MEKVKTPYYISIKNTRVPIAYIDYNKLNKILKSKDAPVLRSCAPEQISCFEYSWINIRQIGCKYDSNQIIEKWTKLVQEGFLLEDIAERLTTADRDNLLKFPEYYIGIPENHKEPRVLPSWHHLVRLVDLYLQIENCEAYKKINGFKQRLGEAEKELNEKLKGEDIEKLYEKIISTISELVFISNLCTCNTKWDKLELHSSGSDFQIYLPFIGRKKIEMKARIIKDDLKPQKEPYDILELSIPWMFLLYAQPPSEKAFNGQEADITLVNLSHCYAGLLFKHANTSTKNGNLSFEYALDKAIELVKEGNKAVVVFVELYAPFRLLAQTIDNKFLYLGRELVDRIRDVLKKKWWGIEPTPDEIMQIMDTINRLEPTDDEVAKIIDMIAKLESTPHEISKIKDTITKIFSKNNDRPKIN